MLILFMNIRTKNYDYSHYIIIIETKIMTSSTNPNESWGAVDFLSFP